MQTKSIFMSQSKGQVGFALAGIIVGLVLLFVGLFMVNAVSEVFTNTSLVTCTFASTRNSTSLNFNSTRTLNISFTATTFTNRCGQVNGQFTAFINNTTSTAGTVTILLNGAALTTTAVPATNTTINVSARIIPSSANIINVSSDTSGVVNVTFSTLTTSSSEANKDIGNIYDSTVNTTGTIFSVLGLVLIIVSLALAIGSLVGMSKEA